MSLFKHFWTDRGVLGNCTNRIITGMSQEIEREPRTSCSQSPHPQAVRVCEFAFSFLCRWMSWMASPWSSTAVASMTATPVSLACPQWVHARGLCLVPLHKRVGWFSHWLCPWELSHLVRAGAESRSCSLRSTVNSGSQGEVFSRMPKLQLKAYLWALCSLHVTDVTFPNHVFRGVTGEVYISAVEVRHPVLGSAILAVVAWRPLRAQKWGAASQWPRIPVFVGCCPAALSYWCQRLWLLPLLGLNTLLEGVVQGTCPLPTSPPRSSLWEMDLVQWWRACVGLRENLLHFKTF